MGLLKPIHFEGPLANRVDVQADSASVAHAMAALWEEIATVLSPIVGERGVVALYRRSLHLAGTDYPWLADLQGALPGSVDLPTLRSAFAAQSPADAAAAGIALLQTFHGLLVSLIGDTLTERLLLPVWTNTLHGPAAPESTP